MLEYAYGYESPTDTGRWLVLREKDNLKVVPEAELNEFGTPKYAQTLHLGRGRPMTMSADDLAQLESKGYVFIGGLRIGKWTESTSK